MKPDLLAFLIAAGGVTLAEMGDKTQLLAMAFACRFKALKVLTGVFIATVLNHALAVALGNLITRFEPLQLWIQVAASISFLVFGLWTIRGDRLEGEENRKTRFGPVITVTVAFFIAELGDKTQLATIALAAKYPESPVWILAGTTTGMLIADALGIIIGVVMCKKIPERTIKLVSAGAFILFGLIGSFETVKTQLGAGTLVASVITIVLAAVSGGGAYFLYKRTERQTENETVAEYCSIREKSPKAGEEN